MEEIDLFLAPDESIPPGIDSDYSDSEGDNLLLERLLHDDPTPLPDIPSLTHVTFPFEDHHDLNFTCVIRVFLPFFTYPVTSSFLLSSESEDTMFDLGISIYHSFMQDVSHRCGTFMKFNVYPNHLNESIGYSQKGQKLKPKGQGRARDWKEHEKTSPTETEPVKDYILLPLWTADPPFSQDPKSSQDDGSKPSSDDGKKVDEDPRKENECNDQEKEDNVNSTNNVNVASTNEVNAVNGKTGIELPVDPNMPALEDISIFDFSRSDEDDDAEADMNNLDTTIQVSPNPTTRIHKDHPLDQVIGDLQSATQTRNMSKNLKEHGIEAIRLLLAYASFKDFVVYQMDVKSSFLYGKIEEEVYVCQPPGFEDLDFSDRVYKVEKALYGLHQAPRAWYETLSTYMLDNEFQRGKIDKTLFIKRYKHDILMVQLYVDDIIFGSTKKELCNAFVLGIIQS
ncbi:putative ribonuclease H-like domain-containing protein [Tanacetum coccineum]